MEEDIISQKKEAVPDSATHPKPDEIRTLFDEYKVPINIRRHCEAVAKASVILAKKLIEVGADVNVEFTESLALVHDLFKHVTLEKLKEDARFNAPTPSSEEVAMHAQLREKYPGEHETTIAHDLFKDSHPVFAQAITNESYGGEPKSWEEKIVGYVDYITFSDRVIGLEPRLLDIEERYNKTDPDKQAGWEIEKRKKKDMEHQIFVLLDITPEDLMELANNG